MENFSSAKTEIYIKGFSGIYYFEFSKNFSHPPEKHKNAWEMVYVDKGRIVVDEEGKKHTLTQGEAIFHAPGEEHFHSSDNQVANNMLVVTFKADSDAMDFFRSKIFTLDKTSKTLLSLFLEEAKNAMGKIPGDYNFKNIPDFSKEEFGSSQLMFFHFTELLIKLVRGNGKPRLSAREKTKSLSKNTLAEMVLDYFGNNLYSSFTLNDVYTEFFIGKSQLNTIFREVIGKSPKECYNSLKIEEAKKLLREDNLSVSEIGDRLCYSGIQNFSRAFKKATGFSPVEYKKSIL